MSQLDFLCQCGICKAARATEKAHQDGLTEQQEMHLESIKKRFDGLVDGKYRKGAADHGGDLLHLKPIEVLDMAIDEAIDQVVYLLTLKELLPRS